MKDEKRPRTDGLQTTAMRKYPVAPRAYTGASMATEYQQRFLPPRCFSAFVPTSKSKAHYHPLRGAGVDMSSPRSSLMDRKWIKHPPGVTPEGPGGSTSDQYSSRHSTAIQKEEGISAYMYYFQPWKAEKRLPIRPMDNLKVNQCVGYTDNTSGVNCILKNCVCPADKREAFENITSYRYDYVAHPVLPRLPMENTVHQNHQNGKMKNSQHLDETSGIIYPFMTRSLTESDSPAYLSTMRADYTAYKPHPKTQPILPPTSTNDKSTAPFEGTTTMRESFKAWDFPQSHHLVHRSKMEWPRKGSNVNPCAKCAAKTSSSNLTQKTPRPVENGAVSDFKGPEETHM